jgi:translation initiation factor 4G
VTSEIQFLVEPPQQRRRLVLQPRTIPKENDSPSTNPPSPAGSENGSDDEESAAAAPDMSDEEAKKKIEEDIKELFAVRNLDEAEVYFTALPTKHHSTLVDKIVTKAVESKATDAELVASFFERACSKELCSSSSFESGFEPIAEFIYDIALDAPMAPQLFAKMVKAAGLSEQARQQIASKSPDSSEDLLALLS